MSTKSPENFLSPDQRALLLAALNSNVPINASQPRSTQNKSNLENDNAGDTSIGDSSFDNSFFTEADAIGEADYNFEMGGFYEDFGTEIQKSNGTPSGRDSSGNEHEKRKLSFDDDEDEEADPHETEPKRREGDDKTAKKPGRKPITNEPTSKRKAQNRAAQRAFRERKEKHLKDLEQKVQDLEKESENTSQENKALKEQVDRLQTELKEYRKRFSMGSGVNRSPSNSISTGLGSYDSSLGNTGGFNFDFPLFGNFSAPGQNYATGNKNIAKGSPNRGSSISPTNYKVSPGGILELDNSNRAGLGSIGSNNNSPVSRTNSNGFPNSNLNQSPLQVHRVSVDEPRFNSSDDLLRDLFSPTLLQQVNNDLTSDYMNAKSGSFSSSQSTPHMSSLFSFSDSPSASSVSQHSMKNGNNNTSSCGTTPEAMDAASPPSLHKADTPGLQSITEEGEQRIQSRHNRGSSISDAFSFCESLGQACGNSSNPFPPAGRHQSSSETIEPVDNSFQWLAAQNGGNFEPLLFNDYRDSTNQLNSVGMSYFDDAFPSAFDMTTLPPTPPVSNLDKTSHTKVSAPGLNEDEDGDEVYPAEDQKSLLKCNQIWDKVQSHPKFASGEIDMDNLCSELRAKAKCSEKGVVVDKKDVDSILNQPIQNMWGL